MSQLKVHEIVPPSSGEVVEILKFRFLEKLLGGVTYRKDWVSGETYNEKDVVIYDDLIYRANVNHTAGETFALAYWDLLDVSISVAGVTPGEYTKVTVNELGRVVSGAPLTSSDLPAVPAEKITGVVDPDNLGIGTPSNDLFLRGDGVWASPTALIGTVTETQIATAGQTLITLVDYTYIPGSNSIAVYLNGIRLESGVDYTESSNTTLTMVEALSSGDKVVVVRSENYTNLVDPTIRAQLAASDGASLVGYQSDGTGAIARTAQDKMRESVSVKDFGAVGDGVTDDTAAIQAALNSLTQYSTLYFPSGQYLVSNTLTLRRSYVSIIGDGSGATTILRTNGNYGDTFLISPTNPATDTFMLSVTMRGIKIRANVEMNSGAHLRLSEVTQSQFSDVFLEDGFVGLRIEGVRNTHFDGIKIEAGKYFATTKVGSRFVLIEDSPKTGQENTEIFFDSFNWTFTINATVEYGLELKESDGIWFSNGHILGAATADFLLNLDGSLQTVGVQFDNVWFDGFTQSNVVISNAPAGTAKEINFNSCTFSGSTQYAVWATSTAVFEDISFTGCSFTSSDGVGVRIHGGDYWSFTGCDFADINRSDVANSYAIKVLVDTEINVLGGHIGKITAAGDELDYGIEIDTAGTKFNINGVSFWNIQVNEVFVPTTAELKGWVGNCTTDRANFNHVTLVSNAAVVPAVANSAYISGTGSVNTMVPTWEGREVLLVGNGGSFTITHSAGGANQFLINGNTNVTLLANRGKQFQYFDTLNSWLDVK